MITEDLQIFTVFFPFLCQVCGS